MTILTLQEADFEPINQDNIGNFSFTDALRRLRRSFVGVHNKIAPVVVLNDAANPVLASLNERGSLKYYTGSVSVTGIANFTIALTVPPQKKWVLKAAELAQNGGTFTITGTTMYISDVTPANVNLYYILAAAHPIYTNLGAYEITLPAGYQLSTITAVGAWVAIGAMSLKILVQEFSEAQ